MRNQNHYYKSIWVFGTLLWFSTVYFYKANLDFTLAVSQQSHHHHEKELSSFSDKYLNTLIVVGAVDIDNYDNDDDAYIELNDDDDFVGFYQTDDDDDNYDDDDVQHFDMQENEPENLLSKNHPNSDLASTTTTAATTTTTTAANSLDNDEKLHNEFAHILYHESASSTADNEPCVDRHKNCHQWSLVNKCRMKTTRSYMVAVCPLSCNLCNPQFQVWKPPTTLLNFDESSSTTTDSNIEPFHHADFMTDLPIHLGVPQIINDVEPPHYDNWEKRYKHQLEEILAAQEIYLQRYYSPLLTNGTNKSTKTPHYPPNHSISIPPLTTTTTTTNSDKFRLPLPETCVNRHPYCAIWAAKGFCEFKVFAMAESCALICHMCEHTSLIDGQTVYVEPSLNDKSWFVTPFQRMDLTGIFRAIMENRIIYRVGGQTSTDHHHYSRVKGKYDDTPVLHSKMVVNPHVLENKNINGHNHHVIEFEKFFSPEECQSILDTVRFGVGVGQSSQYDSLEQQDGFPSRSVHHNFIPNDDLTDDENGDYMETLTVTRSSSSVYLYPSFKDDKTGQSKFAPAIERLLSKLMVVSSIPADLHIESPIQIDKFENGDFELVKNHFEDAVLAEENRIVIGRLSGMKDLNKDSVTETISTIVNETIASTTEEMSKEFILDSEDLSDGDNNEKNETRTENIHATSRSQEPDLMENSRILGLTVFLNDVAEGGELHFPYMNVTIKPSRGKAVLFPTVSTLIGQDPKEAKRIYKKEALDKIYPHTGADRTVLAEDLTTRFRHEEVKAGVKYSITLYLRRYPTQYITL